MHQVALSIRAVDSSATCAGAPLFPVVQRFAVNRPRATLTIVMRLSRLSLTRTLFGLTLAIASPGLELSHGMAHDHDHDAGAHHTPVERTDHDAEVGVEPSPSDHPHERVSDALRIRVTVLDYLPLPAGLADFPTVIVAQAHSSPISEPRLFGDRPTGPPPRLRGPPRE